jgi:hypothetical protein
MQIDIDMIICISLHAMIIMTSTIASRDLLPKQTLLSATGKSGKFMKEMRRSYQDNIIILVRNKR